MPLAGRLAVSCPGRWDGLAGFRVSATPELATK
jgi:hypothetical protein